MGRLNLTTTADVQAHTMIDDLKALDYASIQRLIDRAESAIDRYGRFDSTKANYAEDMKLAANLVVERLFLRSDPDYLKGRTQGIGTFKAGSYEQENVTPEAVLSGEVVSILNVYCVERYSYVNEVWLQSSPNPFTTEFADE